MGDLLVAVLAAGGAIAVAVAGHDSEDGTSRWVGVAGLGVVAGFEGLMGIAGLRWNRKCREAREQWDQRQIEQDTLVRESTARQEIDEEKARQRQMAPAVPVARGFYCSSAPAAGFCVRDKAECVRTRDVSIGALPDLTECALTEAAWCLGDLCFPGQEACDARRQRTQRTQIVEPCVETR